MSNQAKTARAVQEGAVEWVVRRQTAESWSAEDQSRS